MEPRIQYAKTSDGVSIAHWVQGQGSPLVHMPWHPVSHIQLEWESPEWNRWYRRLLETRQLVRFDLRGTGLSDRKVSDYSLDALERDLEAVVEHQGLTNFALFAFHHAGFPSLAYAAHHPERVSHLILWCCCARGSDWWSADVQAFEALLANWERFTGTLAHDRLGWSHSEAAQLYASIVSVSTTPDAFWSAVTAMREYDVSDLLPAIRAQTLVLHRRNAHFPPMTVVRELTSQIPGAELVLLEGVSLAPYLEDSESVAIAIEAFIDGHELPARRLPDLPTGTAIILFADIADSTALTERLGDAAFRDKARDLDASLRMIIRERSGTAIEGKLLGDGVLAVFTSAREAIGAALRCGDAGNSAGLSLHLGLHAGDVIREENNVYGGAVNIASRISGLSAPGELLVSDIVRGLARTSAGVRFEDRGEQALKGVGEPVRVWAVVGAE